MPKIEKNPFKVGDKVICIAQPPSGHYQCNIGATGIVSKIWDNILQTENNICSDQNFSHNDACYQFQYFKLQKKTMSFKALKES